MGMMVSEVYDALVDAGSTEAKARAAAEAIPAVDQLATKQDIPGIMTDISNLKTFIWQVAVGAVVLGVTILKFLDWGIRQSPT